MGREQELGDLARATIDGNVYLTLGTADEAGVPWTSPVYFVCDGYKEFYWASAPEARHSLNLAVRPQLSLVVFDSGAPVYQGRAVYVSAVGEELSGDELDRGIEIYNGPAAVRGVGELTREDVEAPALHRLYRAVAVEQFTTDPAGHPVHGRALDHRTAVIL
ncbi:pyridoxamine 5'-phosphate oxidase family protein [Amycolatopsis sp.]|jgi:hypothetical protein|uniref:pyridoxamine 5'-phosphate oxidase family protein n=1 Tax=Amycolatopsis sp. TaxID=37632 RepID=UPI002E007868|nr:pyridoxamine 5'-phosphate oxidase family protein [Amycolatopsis sp.]